MSTTLPPELDSIELATEFRQLIDAGRADEVVQRSDELRETDLRDAPEVELELARALARTGRLERAMGRATTALWGFRVKRDLRGQMRANLVLGGLAFEQGHPDAAEHHFGLVRVVASSLNDQKVLSQVTNNLACLALQKGDFQAAESLLQSSLEQARALADLRSQAEILHNLNGVYRALGQFERGLDSGRQAVSLSEQMQDWSMLSLALGGLAETTPWLASAHDPELLLAKAEAAADRAGDPIRKVSVLRVRAVLALKHGDHAAAFALGDSVKRLAEQADADLLGAEGLAIMAIARRRQGKEAEATRLRDQAAVALYRLRAYRETDWFECEWAASPSTTEVPNSEPARVP